MALKPIAISLGDPAGIGPEVTAKALKLRPSLLRRAWLFGDPASVPKSWRPQLKGCRWTRIESKGWRLGRPSPAGGRLAHQSVIQAAEACLGSQAGALVTAPLSKEALHLAGIHEPGHTEILANLAGLHAGQVGMLLVGGGLRVFLVTRHMSLKKALGALKPLLLKQALELCASGLRQSFKIRRPRLALAALNPHAGEAGAFGSEEQRLLKPFVQRQARRRDCSLEGPLPADTVFVRALRGNFDAVLCLYHDQALIPLKLLAFESGVNVTLGLPFVRTSPDHGTAYDIAGRSLAHPGSMLAALDLVAKLGA